MRLHRSHGVKVENGNWTVRMCLPRYNRKAATGQIPLLATHTLMQSKKKLKTKISSNAVNTRLESIQSQSHEGLKALPDF